MEKQNAQNARNKRDYFDQLKYAQGRDETSVDKVCAALARFEEPTRHKNFKRFHRAWAKAFELKLEKEKNPRTGKLLSRVTADSTLSALHFFFIWLAGRPCQNPPCFRHTCAAGMAALSDYRSLQSMVAEYRV